MFSQKSFLSLALVSSLSLIAACNGGGGGGGGSVVVGGGTTTPTTSYSPAATASQFVTALNNVAGIGENGSYIELDETQTYRSYEKDQEQWFVIYDDKYNEHKAVSLQYIRSIVYYDYYYDSRDLADEFRAIERDHILSGNVNGDYYGDDYEVVDFDYLTNAYEGRNSGFYYEDEAATTDVSLLTAELQQKEFFKKAANISLAFNVGLETSLSLVSLGEKTEKMLASSKGALTAEDQAAFAKDLQHLTGVTLADVMEASQSQKAQDDLVEKIANKIGTSSSNLENRILPELFGVEL